MAENPFLQDVRPAKPAEALTDNPFLQDVQALSEQPPSEIPQRKGMDLLSQYAGVINRAVAPYITAQAVVPGLGPLSLAATDIASAIYNPVAQMTNLPPMQSGSEAIRSQYPFGRYGFRQPETSEQEILSAAIEGGAGGKYAALSAGQVADRLNALRQFVQRPSTTENVLRQVSAQPNVAAIAGAAAGAAPQAAVEYSDPDSLMQNPFVLSTISALSGAGTAKLVTRGPQIAVQAATDRGYISEKTRQAAQTKLGIQTSPSLDALNAKAAREYKVLDQSGIAFRPTSVSQMVDDIEAIATKEAVSERPEIRAELNRLRNIRNQSLTLSQINTIRSELQKRLIKSENSNIRRVGREITDGIDDFVINAKPGDVLGGDSSAARSAFFNARKTYRLIARTEEIEEVIRQAKLDAGNPAKPMSLDTALRDKFSTLEKNPNKFFRYTPEEQQFIQYVARGGKPAQFLSNVGETLQLRSQFGGPGFAVGSIGGLGLSQVNPSITSAPEVAGGAALIYGGGRVAAGTSNLLARRRALEMSAGMRGYRKAPDTAAILPSTQAPINFLAEQQRLAEQGF